MKADVILSEAKDRRSFLGSHDSRATAEILRFAQDDRIAFLHTFSLISAGSEEAVELSQ